MAGAHFQDYHCQIINRKSKGMESITAVSNPVLQSQPGKLVFFTPILPKTEMNTCRWPVECNGKAVHDGYCIFHKYISEVPEMKAPRKSIKFHSTKRARDQRAYQKLVHEMLEENPLCEIKEDGCQILATGCHHQRKRTPATILDKKYLKRSCDNCNTWCEIFPKEAIEKGHSHSKF